MPQSPSFADPSSKFYDRLKSFESGGRYGEINYDKDSGLPGALGAYQFRAPPLKDLGYLKSKVRGVWDPGNWTGKGGISSYRDFLDDRGAQDAAAADYVKYLDGILWSEGTYNAIGQTINGQRLTREGLLAAGWKLPQGIGKYVRNPDSSGVKLEHIKDFQNRIGKTQDFSNDPRDYLNPRMPVPGVAPPGVQAPGAPPPRPAKPVRPPGQKRSDAPADFDVNSPAAGIGDDGPATVAQADAPSGIGTTASLSPSPRLIPVDHDPFADGEAG